MVIGRWQAVPRRVAPWEVWYDDRARMTADRDEREGTMTEITAGVVSVGAGGNDLSPAARSPWQ